MWAGWCSYSAAFRDVLGLRLKEHESYEHYEQAALEGGFRVMHEEFCIVSDFPERISKDEQNRPHCDDGPSHRWRDGWSLWYVHGVRVTEQIVMRPETLSVQQIDDEQNAEVRRVMIERFGQERYVRESGAKVVHEIAADHKLIGLRTARLLVKPVRDDEPIVMLDMLNSTPEPDGSTRRYMIRIDPNAYGGKAARDCLAAMASTYRMPEGSMLFNSPADYAPSFES